MHVLIADDDRVSALVLEESVRASGHEVTVVRDGAQAWEALQSENRPQLAILDWVMPVMNGIDVCRNLRSAGGPYVYVLLLTANRHQSDVILGIDAGADDYIKKPFDPEELRARLRSGARIVELQEKLRVQASNDALTGLLNRGAIMERLAIEFARACPQNTAISIAMMDLDHFKQINDSYGHAAGDIVLRETADRMKAVLRPYDSIGRYGGEEFIFALPGNKVSNGADIAERVLRSISIQPVQIGSARICVTASIGIADACSSKDVDSLIRAADGALFRAKAAGRNRVESHRAVEPGPQS